MVQSAAINTGMAYSKWNRPPLHGHATINPHHVSAAKYAGQVFKIVKVMQVNAVGENIITGARLRAPFELWVAAQLTQLAEVGQLVQSVPEVERSPLQLGMFVVRSAYSSGKKWDVADTDIMVVIKKHPDGSVNLAHVNGTCGDKYWVKIPRRFIVPVKVDLVITSGN